MQSITIDGTDEDQVIIWKIQNECYLICIIDQSIDSKMYMSEVDDALDMIEQSKYTSFSAFPCLIYD